MITARPNRVTHSYVQRLVAGPAEVFPLLCPVREADWIAGWNPSRVLSDSGRAEADCVFTTPEYPNEAIWYVTRHEPDAGFVEMIRITPELTACRLTIQLRATNGGSAAIVTYTHTSLGPRGDEFIAAFTSEHYARFMQDWETRLNHYLAHGKQLHSGPAIASNDA